MSPLPPSACVRCPSVLSIIHMSSFLTVAYAAPVSQLHVFCVSGSHMPVVVQSVGQAWHCGGRITESSWAGSEELEKGGLWMCSCSGPPSLAVIQEAGPGPCRPSVIKGKVQLLPLLLTRRALHTGPGSSCGLKGALRVSRSWLRDGKGTKI